MNFALFPRKSEISEDMERISAGVMFLRLVVLKQAKKDVKLIEKKKIKEAMIYLLEIREKISEEAKKKES